MINFRFRWILLIEKRKQYIIKDIIWSIKYRIRIIK